ncbi:MAG: hypothetical protein A2043_11150 [Candidatus Schekmanbacteria bacterium GWA2_38_9]|uniref:Sirohydrochlorin cobaltochelatase n=1 Tax=Candidatus Schekmanbacteria bacterium RIFCSPLOWO2_12_FULL_38_15 TaxID=1817883 RepID=A0A1F7SHR9_9BACT|nr:MAG: hypothetical protein A2043_11150 [Candidatus Schekmanbacteria bacterium GWA2_38_9]OGL49882.1 MAG: hypothetical protein A3H37_09750 [Candidatus Schekmanbacteria bacterium RIFCSPLOWO2_02_FULL_38_14]OGL52778.1 MAG: hypothetical protein A3G31_00050 [Candidatus Schekmanbacteria bacterium RIFCSPLOWO2_12_FULL_38_15]
MKNGKVGIVLAAHGDVPFDYIEENREFFEGVEEHMYHLSDIVKDIPRTKETDPYKFEAEDLIDIIKQKTGYQVVEAGYMNFCSPTIEDCIKRMIANGAKKIVVVPKFLDKNGHSLRDLPKIISKMKEEHHGVEIVYTTPELDREIQEKVAELIIKRLKNVI